LKERRSRQCEKLAKALSGWKDFSTKVVRDVDGTFTDCYFFHQQLLLVTTQPFEQTWIMDDTPLTNTLGFPLVVVVGVDQNHRDQLLAFAFIFDLCAESFTRFLNWVRKRLPPGILPRAFMVDRHAGQLKGIRAAFPGAAVLFCAIHLRSSITKVFKERAAIFVGHYWDAVSGILGIGLWQDMLRQLLEMTWTQKQLKLLQWLFDNTNAYCGELVNWLSFEDVSSRAEGMFGNLKEAFEHKWATLYELADYLIHEATEFRIALAKSIYLPRGFCPVDVLSRDDQFRVGERARQLLLTELEKGPTPERERPPRERVESRACCPHLRRWQMPCIHMIELLQSSRRPCLVLENIPELWRLPWVRGCRGIPQCKAVHEDAVFDLAADYLKAEWDREYGLSLLAPIVNAAPQDATARQWIVDFRLRWDHRRENADDPQAGASDPAPHARSGRSESHPAWKSPISFTRTGAVGRAPRRKKTRRL
jgi:hypothetical protein